MKKEISKFGSSIFKLICGVILLTGCAAPRIETAEAYHGPLNSPGAKFGALPAAVQNTIRAEVGSAEIRDITKELRSIGLVYKTEFAHDEIYPPLYVAADGSVLYPDMTFAVGAARDENSVLTGSYASSISFRDLPGPVVKTIDQYADRSQLASLDKEQWGSRIVYIISFKEDTHSPKLYITAEGMILRDIQK